MACWKLLSALRVVVFRHQLNTNTRPESVVALVGDRLHQALTVTDTDRLSMWSFDSATAQLTSPVCPPVTVAKLATMEPWAYRLVVGIENAGVAGEVVLGKPG